MGGSPTWLGQLADRGVSGACSPPPPSGALWLLPLSLPLTKPRERQPIPLLTTCPALRPRTSGELVARAD